MLESQFHNVIIRKDIGSPMQRCAFSLLLTIAVVAATAFVSWALVSVGFPSPETLGVLFVIPVLFSAIFYGLVSAIIAAFISVLAYNFVLLPPIWHIGLFEIENFTKMAALSLAAIITSALVSRIKKLAWEAMQRERILSGVYALSQDMIGISNVEDMRCAAETKLSSLLEVKVSIILKESIDSKNESLQFCLKNNTPVGHGTKNFSDDNNLYLPLSGSKDIIGIMCVEGSASKPLFSESFSSKILATLAAQTASSIEKAILAEAHEKKLLDIQREKFLSALLSSVSHDFKTPLVTVIGVFSSLKDTPEIIDNQPYREMVAGGLEEAQKLDRFISNLMHISRLESGIESIPKQPVLLRDILASTMKSLRSIIGKHNFSISTSPNFPLMKVNSALMELVLTNLIENAIKYGPTNGDIKIIAMHDGNTATIDVDDDGDGIAENERESVFQKFYRSKHGDSKIAGTGLGLYICRGIVEAHGGTVTAINPHDGKGACMRITLPSSALIPIDIEQEIE